MTLYNVKTVNLWVKHHETTLSRSLDYVGTSCPSLNITCLFRLTGVNNFYYLSFAGIVMVGSGSESFDKFYYVGALFRPSGPALYPRSTRVRRTSWSNGVTDQRFLVDTDPPLRVLLLNRCRDGRRDRYPLRETVDRVEGVVYGPILSHPFVTHKHPET